MHKRIAWLDAIKGLMILFVILCHSLVLNQGRGVQGHDDAVILYIINTFIMPVFFAVSGFLYKRVRSWRDYRVLWYKKGLGLAVPYLIISIALYCYMRVKGSMLSILYQPIFLMWFLYALFFIFIIVGTLDLLHVSMGDQFILYLVVLVAQTRLKWWNGPNFDMNPVACTLGYIAFFYVGFLIKHYYQDLKGILSSKLLTLVLMMIMIIGIWLQAKLTDVFPYNTDQVMLSDVITKMISIFAFFSLFMAFRQVRIGWLDTIGRSTLVVYLVHYFAVHSVFTWIMTYTAVRAPMLQTGIRFVTGVIASLIAMWLVKHVGIFKAIFYPRKYTDKWVLKK